VTLTPGARLGPYEILGLLGSGGMGEVYRARDTRLARDVAIKVLPSSFSADLDRLRRFEQEARAAAALNHPNILAVYDIGSQPAPYIVSELLDGETLADRLTTGQPLPVRKAIDYGIQVANGLAAAHDKGVVHRDLKPGNVFVTSTGRVKILDFGLAKLVESQPVVAGTVIATMAPETGAGVVLGTVGYMAPEQVRGLPVDHRADLFAFGAILYEMLAGHRAFSGDTGAEAMTAILKEDPVDLSSAERHLPPALTRIVDRCLEKNPSARFQSAGDLAFALEALSTPSGSIETAPIPRVLRARIATLPWIIVAVLAVALVGVLASALLRRTPEAVRTIRFSVPLPEGWQLALANTQGTPTSLTISPDGRRIATVARRADGQNTILIRSLDSTTAQPLAGTDGVGSMFWSPDSRFLAFFADQKLKKIDVTGGPPTTLCDAARAIGGGTWSRDNVIVFSMLEAGGYALKQVPASGGIPTDAFPPQTGYSRIRPFFLPDGRHVLFAAAKGGSAGLSSTVPIYAAALGSAEAVKLFDSGSTNVQYAQGHLLFLREATLMAQPFDAERLRITGEVFPVADQIQRQGVLPPYGLFSASEDGVLVFASGMTSAVGFQLTWVDRTGKPVASVGDRGLYLGLSVSPDSTRAAVVNGLGQDLWVVDLVRGVQTRLTFGTGPYYLPVWSPEGGRIAFAREPPESGPSTPPDLYVKASNGTGTEELLLKGGAPLDWSPDGRFLLVARFGTVSQVDLWVLPLSGDRKPFAVATSNVSKYPARFSPDGRWIAYASAETGRQEVYVIPFDPARAARHEDVQGKWQVSTSGGSIPAWRGDGKEIFFFNNETNAMMAAAVNGAGAAFEVGASQTLFRIPQPPVQNQTAGLPFDVTRDGQRFLIRVDEDRTALAAPSPTAVVNWLAASKK
jgi:serine/threonine protein kinase/Tol biopolymer transport system component